MIFLAVGGTSFDTYLTIEAKTGSSSSSMDSGMLILYIVIGTLAFLVLLYIVFIIVRTKRLRRVQESKHKIVLNESNVLNVIFVIF